MQTELNEFEARIEGELGNYLPLSGGTMRGSINLHNNWLTRVGAVSFLQGNQVGVNCVFLSSAPGRPTFNYPMYVFKGDDASANKEAGIEVNLVELGNSVSMVGVQGGDAPWTGDKYKLVLFHSDGVEAGPVYVTNVATPITDDGAANKQYVDTVGENLAGEIAEVGGQLGNYLPLSGGQMRGNLDMNFKNIENIRQMGFGEAGYSRYYVLFKDETLKLIDENIPSQDIGHFNLDCEAITTWRGYLNNGVRIWTSAMSTRSKPVLDIEGITDAAKVRITNIATPIGDDDVATKGYVDSANEGFLYVDGGRLYARGDTPQDVLLDKIDFASQEVEEAGVATLSISGTTGNLVMSILDKNLTHVPLRFGVGELTDGSAGVNMAVLGKYMRGGVSESVTSANVKSTDLLTGLYIVRYVSEVYMINVTGSELGNIVITSSKIMGTDGGITFTTEVVDVNTMKLTFSSALESGFQVTKLTGGAYVEVSILS